MSGNTIPAAELFEDWRKDPEYMAEYEALESEFSFTEALIIARTKSHLTQEEVALRMGTSRTAVARLEGGKGNPSVKTLRRYAHATGTRLRVCFESQE